MSSALRRSLLVVRFFLATALVASLAQQGLAQRGNIHHPGPTTYPKPAVAWVASPNYNSRTVSAVDSVVIHTTEETLQDTFDIFLNPARQVSAHYVIASNGDIYEMVAPSNRAWHATYYNHRSIGIEMVGYSSQSSTWNQNNLSALADLLAWLVQAYPAIPLTHPGGNAYDYPNDSFNAAGIVAHGQIQPWDRTDPGPYFPWDNVLTAVESRLASVPEPTSVLMVLLGGVVVCSRWRRRQAS